MKLKGDNKMKPLIGITASMDLPGKEYTANNDYIEAITRMGGIPIVLPYLSDKQDIKVIVEKLDGLYATGGYDIDPTLFNEEPHPNLGKVVPKRDQFELMLIEETLRVNKPILAVCRGAQVLNIVVGGDMYQDIYQQIKEPLIQHQQRAPAGHGSHFVQVEKDSLLYKLTEMEQFKVNSRHHQANRHVPEPLLISGRSSDNIVEAIESITHDFVLGLQWHPENMLAEQDDEPSTKIFAGFIEACKGGNG